ncbi:macro domain protein (macronuclear) [Tetrahymena thermophila SB210]|uniref:Macro domain protein n=1 Tax=Tetrahymena thermophila (strain SB210) TaxID=312017 RepID=I7MJT3_TETTS|nr:macro domain protein [Tetrahymena thermophila SB210]EAR97167.1 macro domain protein [Tetrahymena thermophila SB210]|eukprot:XP_001017412.1 macro domain protein [Tetrahymena thermophila SB210]
MGICCCKNEPQVQEKIHQTNITYKDVFITFKQGSIKKEEADVLVISTDSFISNKSTSIFNEDMIIQSINQEIKSSRGRNEEPLQTGEIIFSSPGLLKNVKELAHLAVPIWRGGNYNEIEKIVNGYVNILKQCEEKGYSIVMFTDITSGRFGIPKQLGAECFISALKIYLEKEKKTNQITTIKFIHQLKSNLIFFEEFFQKEAGTKEKSQDSEYSDHLKIAYAYSPDNNNSKLETVVEMNGLINNKNNHNEKDEKKE